MSTEQEFDLEIGKYYSIKYRHNGNLFDSYAAFKRFEFGFYYFKEDSGDWLIVKPKNILLIR